MAQTTDTSPVGNRNGADAYIDTPMKSEVFKMSAFRFATELLFRYGSLAMIAALVLGLAGLGLGVAVNPVWLVLGLLIMFVILPFTLATVYYYHGLRRECFVNALPHELSLAEEGIMVRLHLKEMPDEGEEDTGKKVRIKEEIFPYADLLTYRVGPGSVSISVKGKGFLWIPEVAFGNAERLGAFIERAYELKNNCK